MELECMNFRPEILLHKLNRSNTYLYNKILYNTLYRTSRSGHCAGYGGNCLSSNKLKFLLCQNMHFFFTGKRVT